MGLAEVPRLTAKDRRTLTACRGLTGASPDSRVNIFKDREEK
ncbi:hypothetical protein [Xylanibacter muris]|nr:hypothetical protein [Xylanibacter muris]